ncbi:MAG: LL-diaminopimelate aminotransferase, partial [Clostridia bacterium]|nr:LL-diaminopimelate aminotransferase [Clostridia bacterium]
MKINGNYKNLKESYLFKTVAQKKAEYLKNHPDADIINMGIGDVTLPLCKATIDEMEKAVTEMGVKETFKGYPDYYGEPYLLDAIQNYYKTSMGVTLTKDEINVTCGAKEDVSNILDIFSSDTVAVISDPVYPVYLDSNVMAGRPVRFMAANKENDFLPMPKDAPIGDIYYLCSPNNPTGACYNYDQLKEWVAFAKKNNAVILFDAAYEIFAEPGLPRSIFEIEGAKECAIEFCSMSKTAGFTGTRCGYTVIPEALKDENGEKLLPLWKRRQSTKFNGTAHIVQRGAAAVFTEEGYAQIKENIAYYKRNTAVMMAAFDELGIKYYGGKNSPYVWLECP